MLPKCYFEPTVIHRANLKARPGIPLSKENQNDGQIVSPDSSPNNSGNDLSSGKDSNVRPGDSTGITSVESQSSSKAVGRSQQASTKVNLATPTTIKNDLGNPISAPSDETVPLYETQYFTPSKQLL